ncbi:DUF1659 domain-containing protein [Enterococcus sp. LJL98]
MKTHNQTKLTVQLSVEGEEKLQKQSFSNVKADASEEAILALGEVVASFDPENSSLDSMLETVEFEYRK